MGFEKSDNIGSFQIPLFYVIRNSVGIPYYIKRYCVPESAVHGEKNVLLYYFRNVNEKLFVLWHY